MKHRSVFLCGALAALLMAATARAVIYKWTDDKGEAHYAQTPPTGVAATEVKPAAPPPGAGQPNETLQKQLKDFEASRLVREHSASERAATEEVEKIRTENCQRAQENLTLLQSHGQISLKEGDTYRKLTEEERQAQISEALGHLDEFCKKVAGSN